MNVIVNGAPRDLPEATTVAQLVTQLGLTPPRVAVELNRDLLPRARYAETTLKANDEVELVTLVGGG